MKVVTKKIMITLDEYHILEWERIPYIYRDRTPVMDKIRKAGINPNSLHLMIEHKDGTEYVTLSETSYKMNLSERIEQGFKTFYHYIGLIPSPTRKALNYPTLKKHLKRLKEFIKGS